MEAESVSLCDTVHVFISKLGIEVSSKVTETEYDTLLERYNSITLSNSTVSSRNSSLTGSLNSIRNTATIAYDTAVRAETAVGGRSVESQRLSFMTVRFLLRCLDCIIKMKLTVRETRPGMHSMRRL